MQHEESAIPVVDDESRTSLPQTQQERKERVLTQGTPSVVRSIADAVVIKDEGLFLLTTPDGRVPLQGEHGYGLYFHDCRFLNGYELKLAGGTPSGLAASAAAGFMAVFQLTNTDLRTEGGRLIPKEQIGVKWQRVLDAKHSALDELLTFRNFGLQPLELPVSFTFQAGFEDVFAVRGLLPETLGRLRPPEWRNGILTFIYDGADGVCRSLSVQFSTAPEATDGPTAHFRLRMQPQQSQQIVISLDLAESPKAHEVEPEAHHPPDLKDVQTLLRASTEEWLGRQTAIHSDSLMLNRIIDRSLRDLRALRSRLDGHEYFAAGVPWFVTLFGRDSLTAALMTLAYEPAIAASTLRLLAQYQGQQVNDWRDEQPGKILHEYRDGELARTGQIPHSPYYGTVDATPLFLILLGRHAAWTGDLTLFHELRVHVELALEWMIHYGDADGDGFIEYASTSDKGLINQGWKDSGDAIVNADGSLARPPIALVEVQGYAYQARLALADLYRRAGESERADQLQREADELRARLNRAFWLEEHGYYALALQADKQPCAVASSNPGHILWSGTAEPDKARRTMERLLADDLFNGWGVRTLSSRERRYNPVSYHLGTVWPHDNALIAAGFRRYGFDDAARRVFTALVEAATYFADDRLPELFAGFERSEYGVPVHYPVACHPQAWAAGTVPYLIETLLGLMPEAFEQRLRIVQPCLPDFTDSLELRGIRVGHARADLRFARAPGGSIAVNVLKIEGQLDIVVEPGT